METLTKKEKSFYDKFKRLADKLGYTPTVRQLREVVNLSSLCTIHYYTTQLENKNAIRRISRRKVEFLLEE